MYWIFTRPSQLNDCVSQSVCSQSLNSLKDLKLQLHLLSFLCEQLVSGSGFNQDNQVLYEVFYDRYNEEHTE